MVDTGGRTGQSAALRARRNVRSVCDGSRAPSAVAGSRTFLLNASHGSNWYVHIIRRSAHTRHCGGKFSAGVIAMNDALILWSSLCKLRSTPEAWRRHGVGQAREPRQVTGCLNVSHLSTATCRSFASRSSAPPRCTWIRTARHGLLLRWRPPRAGTPGRAVVFGFP
jgi:hypothetical protein